MKNKVLVKLIVPEIDNEFDLFLPVNEILWKAKKMIIKVVNDLSFNALNVDANYVLLNKKDGKLYNNNVVIIDTDIRNGTELVLLSKKM